MCIICTEWNKVSPREIARGALELSEEHFDEVLDKIQQLGMICVSCVVAC